MSAQGEAVLDALETLDSAMFSGDYFLFESNRQQLESYMNSWHRQLLTNRELFLPQIQYAESESEV